jgi:hypothetical protein
VFVTTDDQLATAGQGTSDELVVVRVRTDGLHEWLCLAHFSFDDYQFQQPGYIHPGELLMQLLSNPPVHFKISGVRTN